MITALIKKLYQQLLLLLIVALIAMAAYVSVGRQFMPAISGYKSLLEEQIALRAGLPVTIGSVAGEFLGFNPVLLLSDLQLAIDDRAESPSLEFSEARIAVDIGRSIWHRRWVLGEFVIRNLRIDLTQNTEGAWQLSGVATPDSNDPADLNALYQTFLSFTELELQGVAINVHPLNGDSFSFVQGTASVRNQGQNHYLHVNASLEGNPEPLTISFELQGEDLNQASGMLHILVPDADYSQVFAGQDLGALAILGLEGSGQVWIGVEAGQLSAATVEFDVPGLTISGKRREQARQTKSEQLGLTNLKGMARLSHNSEESVWELALANMSVTYRSDSWQSFNAHVLFTPDQLVEIAADHLDLGLLTRLAGDSGVLPYDAATDLKGLNPDGYLRNVSLSLPVSEAAGRPLTLKTNFADLQLGSVRNSPNLWGMDGFVELEFDPSFQHLTGVAEVNSSDFSMNIPSTFTRVWDYSRVNGRLHIDVSMANGQVVKLASDRIVAESDAVNGSVRFTSITERFADGSRDARLDLMVGANRIEGSQKSLYLPDGPNISDNLRNTMGFLERALIDGQVHNSGILYRGSTVSGSDAMSKTFQSFWQLSDGQINFSDDWPNLEALTATVQTDDDKIDITVDSGSSLGLQFGNAAGAVRRDAASRNWLTVLGSATGETSRALEYLQTAPVDNGLKSALASWQSQGSVAGDLSLSIPLDQPEADTTVHLELEIEDNDLTISDYDLNISQLSGSVIYDSEIGFEPTELSGQLFGGLVKATLSSVREQEALASIVVEGAGVTSPQAMIEWPRQNEFVRSLLARMKGDFAYEAVIRMNQAATRESTSELEIRSDLRGVTMDLPPPFSKQAESATPLDLHVKFEEESQQSSGSLGESLRFTVSQPAGEPSRGLVMLGQQRGSLDPLTDNLPPGLAILGDFDRFELESWVDLIAGMSVEVQSESELDQAIAFADIRADVFSLYGEEMPEVGFRVEPSLPDSGWVARLTSESVQGQVVIPYDSNNYLQVDLDYLYLSGTEELTQADLALSTGVTTPTSEDATPDQAKIDPLESLDPRELPLMRFETDEFRVGESEYGSWAFTLTPTGIGAEFFDINFDFRGLRLGRDSLDDSIEFLEPHFSWFYDGVQHSSELTGVLIADDISGVLEANGYAPSVESDQAVFVTEVRWPGSPAFFSNDHLDGRIDMKVADGRFLRDSDSGGALRLVSFINLSAIFQRLRFSDDLLRSGLAFDEITGQFDLNDGLLQIMDRLVISGPSSLYQIVGEVDLARESVEGEMTVTLPVSNNLPWIGLLSANIPLAVGAYLFDQIFGSQVDSLSSAIYSLSGPIEGLEPQFKQAFGASSARQIEP